MGSVHNRGFFYQTLLKSNIEKAENSKELVEIIRGNPLQYSLSLDQTEREASLYADNKGVLRVLIPKIQSELLLNKKQYNFNNPERLIIEVERRFNCKFEKYQNRFNASSEKLNSFDVKLGVMSTKDIIRKLIDDSVFYEQLKCDFHQHNFMRKRALVSRIRKRAVKNDLYYLFDRNVDYEIIKRILTCHLKAGKDNPCSYLKDKDAMERVLVIRRNESKSIDKKMYLLMEARINQELKNGTPTYFSNIAQIDDLLKNIFNQVLKQHGHSLESTSLNVQHFRNLLDIQLKKSNGSRIRVIQGFKDLKYLQEKYG